MCSKTQASDMSAEVSSSEHIPPREDTFKFLLDAANKTFGPAEITKAEEEEEKPATPEAVPGMTKVGKGKGKSDLRSLKKQPQLGISTLKTLPKKVLRELFTIPGSDLYSKKVQMTCSFYEDGRCNASFDDYCRQDRILQLMDNHLKSHIEEEDRKGEEFFTSSIQYREMCKLQKDAKTKKPKASPPHGKDDSSQPPRKKPAVRKRKASTKGSLQEGEKPQKKSRKNPSILTKQEEDRSLPAGEVLPEGMVTNHCLLDHTYAAPPGSKPKKEEPASPTSSESGSFASDVSGISLETSGPNDDAQSVLSGDPFAAHEETVSQAQERQDGDGARFFTRKRAVVPKSPEEIDRALKLLEDLKNKKKGSKLECDICPPGRTFTAMASLANHYKSQHAGQKQFFCDVVGCPSVGFTRRNSLKYHEAMHKGDYHYKCKHCDKKCRHKSHFEEHMRKHTGETPWACQFCENKYKTRNTYKRHLRTAHGQILTQHGLFPMSEDEYEKVRTKTYKKTTNIKVNSPSSTSGESSSSPKRESASPSTSATPVLPPVGTLLSGLNSMTPTPQTSSEATPRVFPGPLQQGFVYPSIVYPPVPMTLVQTNTMPPVTFGVDHSGKPWAINTTAQVVFINDYNTMVNLGAGASSQHNAAQSLVTSSQPLICSLQPVVPSQQMLVPASQPSMGSTQAPGHNQPMVANMQLPLPTSQPVAPGPQFLVASSVSTSLNPNFQPPLPRS